MAIYIRETERERKKRQTEREIQIATHNSVASRTLLGNIDHWETDLFYNLPCRTNCVQNSDL